MLDRFLADTALSLYRLAGTAATPLLRRHLKQRQARGREDAVRLPERFGHPGQARPDGAVIWLHAASVGESLSALPLIARIRSGWPEITVLVTTGTVTSAQLMAARLPAGAIHHYAPIDQAAAVARFFNHWRPALGLIVESELWPNLVTAAEARGIPLVLINGRISARSHRSWRRLRPIARRLLGCFAAILAQTPEDQARFQALGAEQVSCSGNLKFAAAPLTADATTLAEWQATLGDRPRWVAASTHPGEEDIIAQAHAVVAKQFPNLLTIIVPRHPDRGPEIATDITANLRAGGFSVALRSAGDAVTSDTAIYIADGIGELGLWYRLTEVVLIGGSLIPKGGQNLLEPARLNCALLCGPHMMNFARISAEMIQARALRQITGVGDLAAAVASLLGNDPQRQAMIDAAGAYASKQAGVLDAIVTALTPHLDKAIQRNN